MHHLAKYHISVSLPLFGTERTWTEIKHRQLKVRSHSAAMAAATAMLSIGFH